MMGVALSNQAVCIACGSVNRVPADKPAAAAKCGRCAAPLGLDRPADVNDAQLAFLLEKSTGLILVDVWAPWCVSCRVEHKLLMALAQSGTAPPIVGLNWKDKTREAQELLARTGNPYVAVPDDLSGRVGIDWGVTGTPETYVIDQTGIVRLKHVGPIDLDIWQTKFIPKLKALGA